jgi:hypothetical protein
MKAKRIQRAALTGMLLVAVAGAPRIASAAGSVEGRIAADRNLEIRVVPVKDIGGPVPKLVRRPVDDYAPQVSVWTSPGSGALVYPGQDMTIRFSVDRDAYVVVYDIDTRGQVRLLYPERPGDDGYMRGGRVARIPGPQAGYRLMVTGPEGVERIVALASDRPLVNRWRRFAEADRADGAGRFDTGEVRFADEGDASFEFGFRLADDDGGLAVGIAAGTRGEVAPKQVRRPVDPRLVPVPRGEVAVSRDEAWFRVGKRWRW